MKGVCSGERGVGGGGVLHLVVQGGWVLGLKLEN
jgi:hypothetical protein